MGLGWTRPFPSVNVGLYHAAATQVNSLKGYPLVNVYITMENHHFQSENPLEITMFSSFLYVYQRLNG